MKLLLFLSLGMGCWRLAADAAETNQWIAHSLESSPRVRVVVVSDPRATAGFNVQDASVQNLINQGLLRLTQTNSVPGAWRSLVGSNDVVGLKVFSGPGALSGTRPAVVAAVVHGLIDAGHPPHQIVIWDKERSDLENAGYVGLARNLGVHLAASAEAGYDREVFYENPLLGQLVWGDLEFGSRDNRILRRSYLTRLLTRRVTKIINIAPLLNHTRAGVSGLLYSLTMGSVDNTLRFEGSADALATAVPEIMTMPQIYDRLVLNIVDALLCQYQGEQRGLLHYTARLNQIRLGFDPVALDVLSLGEILNQRQQTGLTPGHSRWELYRNAALMELGICDEHRILVDQQSLSSAHNPGPGRPLTTDH